jgi:MerR family transcriptional regulator/heat shock protein HspR
MADKDYYRILGINSGAGEPEENEAHQEDNITMNEDVEPCYVISVAARLLGIQTHTLRYYERKGIIEPSRSQGNIRLYSRRDIDQLRRVKTLMDDLGVNPAGAEIILRMRQHMAELLRRLKRLESELERLREGE